MMVSELNTVKLNWLYSSRTFSMQWNTYHKQIDLMLLEISKAFDRVFHYYLLAKLGHAYGDTHMH